MNSANNIVTPPPLKRTTLDIELSAMWDRMRVLSDFEKKHHEFLVRMESGYFVLTNGVIVFFDDRKEAVRAQFGAEHWVLRGNVLEKQVDSVTVRLICVDDLVGAEVEI